MPYLYTGGSFKPHPLCELSGQLETMVLPYLRKDNTCEVAKQTMNKLAQLKQTLVHLHRKRLFHSIRFDFTSLFPAYIYA